MLPDLRSCFDDLVMSCEVEEEISSLVTYSIEYSLLIVKGSK